MIMMMTMTMMILLSKYVFRFNLHFTHTKKFKQFVFNVLLFCFTVSSFLQLFYFKLAEYYLHSSPKPKICALCVGIKYKETEEKTDKTNWVLSFPSHYASQRLFCPDQARLQRVDEMVTCDSIHSIV